MPPLHQKIFLGSILFLFSLTLSAQNPGIDSLKRLLPGLREDTNRANTLNVLSRSLWFVGKFEDSKTYAKEALSLSEKLDFKKGSGAAYHNLGKINTYQNNLTEAFNCFNTSLKLMQEAKDIQGICRAYFGLGDCYAVQQNYPEALNNYYTILKINGDKQVSAAALERTASINQYYIGNDSLALKDYLTSAKIYEELGDKIDMGNCYNQMSNLFRNQGKNDAALELAFKAIRLYEEMGASAAAAYTHIAVADIYLSQGKLAANEGNRDMAQQKFKDASKIFDSTIKKVEESGVKNSIAFAYRSMGNTFLELGELKKAKKMLQKSLQFSILAQNYSHIQSAYYSLSVLDTIVGDYKQAYRDYSMSMFYYDSLSNKDASKKLVQMQMTNEFDKKQEILKVEQLKKDEDAKRQRNLQYMTIAGLGILVLVVFLIASIQWKNNKERKRSNILLQQQKEKVENTLSELKTTQAQLIQSEKMASLGQLTAGIAHEIQNPLNFVNNFSEVNKELLAEMNTELQKGNFEDAKAIAGDVMENEERINQHGKRADAIVKGMLQHSRANSGKMELTDLNALSDEYLRLSYHGFRANNKSFNASLQTDFDDSIAKMNIIPEEIGRVLLNLYNNAFYSVSEKKKQADDDFVPTVSVTTKSTGSKVELRVKDNGIGIPKIVLDKIFQPFFTSKPTGQGTGLGLSLAYDIVKAHGGELTVESMEGEGAEFIVRLPK